MNPTPLDPSLNFRTPGYEDLELSTQVLIAEALKRKLKVEVLDPIDQFIRISKGKKVEYIQKATKTSRDSYIVSEIMGNKVVSKIILQESGLSIAAGGHYYDEKSALQDEKKYRHQKIVVKPKNTNYGIGITILPENFSGIDLKRALRNAFQFDQTVLIEEFQSGKECRFLVIDGRCVAVLHRIPANVIGDGKHTIEQLVAIKNRDPRRGKGHKTPLEIIELSDIEKAILRDQRLTTRSIPQKGQQIFLRHNSNISSGGDSVDYTDEVHPEYKRFAERATRAIGAKICGVDLIAENFNQKPTSLFITATKKNVRSNYAIIEVNYNPVLYFHNFPFQGKNRNVGKYVLDLLGF